MTVTAAQIASMLDATLEGDPQATVTRPAGIEVANAGDFTFLDDPRYEHYAYTTKASVLLIRKDFTPVKAVVPTLIRVPNVRESLALLLQAFDDARRLNGSVSPEYAYIDKAAKVGVGTTIGAFSVVEADAVIGNNCIIYPQVYIGRNVKIGNNVRLYPGVRIHYDCVIGDNCILHANAVIGADGFGYLPQADRSWKKVPQVGNVVLENNVEIGACVCIDRATMGHTTIHSGAKLDNLVHIAHNVDIGPNTAIAAQTGIAGSARIGAYNQIGGQVGIAGHITIADGTKIQAQSGIASSVNTPDTALFGSPAIGYKDFIRSYSVFKKLPDLEKKIAILEKKLKDLEG
jgi:UDP-3-O-[3-hydroxymyristoyl] glucosamine N-acyltransferase